MNTYQNFKGAGRMGRQLAHSLLEFGDVEPSELRISTRQPEILSKNPIL